MASRPRRTSNGQSAHSRPAGIMLDTGALIALDRGDKRMIALLNRALAQGRAFRVPAGVVGQAWRDGHVQVTLARFLRSAEVEIIPLDEQLARACGELCRASNSSDIIDASVVILARERRDAIVTSDPNDLRRLDPAAQIIPV
ncbi:MAG: PIN domain-containing protein [Acidobacteriia bacterium]|nr:PIN domain-containing protein [Terriglobia bacterium]